MPADLGREGISTPVSAGPDGADDGRHARAGTVPEARGAVRARRLGWTPTSLRWRLAVWVALVVVVSSGITFFAVYRGTGTQLRRQIDSEIAGDSGELAHALSASRAHTPHAVLAAARAYVAGQPFNASSTVLYALVPGAGTATNTPELLGSHAPDDGESVAVQAQENRAASRLLGARNGFSTLALADVGYLRLLNRQVSIPATGGHGGAQRITVGVGEPLASVARAQHGVARAFILAGFLALAGALLASLLIGSRFSRPLRRMAAIAAQVDAGDLHPRIHDVERDGREVQVLADSFNHMLDRLTDAFAGQREFVADASHELRTPLTVIRGQLEVLAAQANPSGEEVRRVERLAQAEIARITRLVDDLLLLAKAEQTQFLRMEPIDLQNFVGELWDGATLLASRTFELGEVPAGTLHADPDRLAQALRNLIGNAIEHTDDETGLVRLGVERLGRHGRRLGAQAITVRPGDEFLCFLVEDDGPGILPEQRERVFDRFHRTDAARDRASGGAGLGLAIVRAIAEAHGGRVSATASPAGGARIELELPRFTAAKADQPSRLRPLSAAPQRR
ncbi:MAG: HAMP domain-containing sensor histidine kinase [Solirubrobacteraceae bacterium]